MDEMDEMDKTAKELEMLSNDAVGDPFLMEYRENQIHLLKIELKLHEIAFEVEKETTKAKNFIRKGDKTSAKECLLRKKKLENRRSFFEVKQGELKVKNAELDKTVTEKGLFEKERELEDEGEEPNVYGHLSRDEKIKRQVERMQSKSDLIQAREKQLNDEIRDEITKSKSFLDQKQKRKALESLQRKKTLVEQREKCRIQIQDIKRMIYQLEQQKIKLELVKAMKAYKKLILPTDEEQLASLQADLE